MNKEQLKAVKENVKQRRKLKLGKKLEEREQIGKLEIPEIFLETEEKKGEIGKVGNFLIRLIFSSRKDRKRIFHRNFGISREASNFEPENLRRATGRTRRGERITQLSDSIIPF